MTEPIAQTVDPSRAPFAVCTIIWKNYLAHARTLGQSLRAHHPDVPFFVLLADQVDGYFDADREGFEVIEIEQLGIPEAHRFCFQYSPLLLNTAVKPWFLAYLLARHGVRKVLYLDADILVLDRLDALAALLDRFSIVLTPHLTAPTTDPYTIASVERAMLLFGAYNLGFIGLGRSATADQFLAWWRERLWRQCLLSPERGLYVDQKWIDLVPGLFDGVHVLRDPSYNVARWNLHCRPLTIQDDRVLVDGIPCRFFHFSGFDPRHGEVAKGNRFYTFERLGEAAKLYRRYGELLHQNGFAETIGWPQTFSVFDNGEPIPDELRMRYLAMGDKVAEFGDPFASAPPGSFYRAWRAERAGLRPLVTWLRRTVARTAGRVHSRLG
jgi:hypothetical protein